METNKKSVSIRLAEKTDIPFIYSLSPALAKGADFDWHDAETVLKFQDDYIAEMLADAPIESVTLIAEQMDEVKGFIHVREREDEISGERCGTIPLLAVAEEARGDGIGKCLMEAAEVWSQERGFRLLHLEVFSTNKQAIGFYENLEFKPETTHMIKALV